MQKLKILIVSALVATAVGVGIGHALPVEKPGDMMEYRVTAQPGDTIWGICGRIASDRDNMQQVVWEAMKNSHVEKAENLQPGQIIIVRVKSLSE